MARFKCVAGGMCIAGAMAAGLALAVAAGQSAEAMSGYQWKSRPLVVFAPATGHPDLARQRSVVATERAGMRERDMVVVYVVANSVTAELGLAPRLGAAALRQRYGVGNDQFKVLLVGKDGGVKLSQSTPIAARRLFATIDAMPMRRDEVRRR